MIETGKLNSKKVKSYLDTGKRFDGRKPEEFRKIIIETGVSKNAEGSARVKLGKTEVIAGVKLGITTPYSDSPDKGNLMVTSELLPLSSPEFESGPPKFPAIELGRVIDRGIRESKFIHLDKLCIKEGEKVWNVFVDLYSINDDGNLMDAAGIAAIAALRTAKIPKYDEENDQILHEHTDVNVPLKEETPLSITVYKVGDKFIVDPTKEEEASSSMRITTSGSENEFYSMQKGESGTLTMEEMEKFFDMAVEIRKKIVEEIKEQI